MRALILAILLIPGAVFAAPGDLIFSNCVGTGSCTGAGSDDGWIRTVQTSGCYSAGSCLRLEGIWNPNQNFVDQHGAGSTSMGTTAVSGKSQITVVYHTKLSESRSTLRGVNIKTIRPYIASSSYLCSSNSPWKTSVDFYFSPCNATYAPTGIFTPYYTYSGDTRFTLPNGDGTFNTGTSSALVGSFSPGFGTQWTKVRHWLKMPSPKTAGNGEFKLWINEELAFHATNVSPSSTGVSNTNGTFTKLDFYPSSEAEEPFEHWMDEMAIYEGYVPPSGEPIPVTPVVNIGIPSPQNVATSADTLTVPGTSTDNPDWCKWSIGQIPTEAIGTLCIGTNPFACATREYVPGTSTLYVGCSKDGIVGYDSIQVIHTPPPTFACYKDADGDDHGDKFSEPVQAETTCPTDYFTVSKLTTVAGDCNDTPGVGVSIYPGAPEICEDGVIQNCNLTADATCTAGAGVSFPYGLGNASLPASGNMNIAPAE